MKRIYVCIGIFLVVVTFSVISQLYVSDTVRETVDFLKKAQESHSDGDLPSAREYTAKAWEKWRELTDWSNYVLSDLTVASDVTLSLTRVVVLSYDGDGDRFQEEIAATVLLLEHFLADNQNVLGGVNRPNRVE
jgi:hypothetical protein